LPDRWRAMDGFAAVALVRLMRRRSLRWRAFAENAGQDGDFVFAAMCSGGVPVHFIVVAVRPRLSLPRPVAKPSRLAAVLLPKAGRPTLGVATFRGTEIRTQPTRAYAWRPRVDRAPKCRYRRGGSVLWPTERGVHGA
jgi:hypothetical protein